MPLDRYAKGRRYEYKTRDSLRSWGARLIIRSAGSHGPFDLVAFWSSAAWLVQVKVSEKRPSVKFPADLPILPSYCLPMVAWWRPGRSEPEYLRME